MLEAIRIDGYTHTMVEPGHEIAEDIELEMQEYINGCNGTEAARYVLYDPEYLADRVIVFYKNKE